jgi:Mg/Co/Ni transporter MgtE
VRTLLGYDPATAGGLMSPEFLCMYADATREEALERVVRSNLHPDASGWLYAMSLRRHFRGGIRVVDLLRAPEGSRLEEVVAPVQTVTADAGLEEIARLMTDFDLTVVAVVDENQLLLGVITVDDVLELILPEGWRRFSFFGGD